MKYKGLINISETTSLLNENGFLEAENVMIDDSIRTRDASEFFTGFIYDGVTVYPLETKQVTINSVKILLIIAIDGSVYGVLPDNYNQLYLLKKREFDKEFLVTLVDKNNPPTSASILELGNYVYLITNAGSGVIVKDGYLKLSTPATDTPIIVVDYKDATLTDLDNKFPALQKFTADNFTLTPKDSVIHIKNKNEIGGRGYPSEQVTVNERDSYLVHNIGDLPEIIDVFPNGAYLGEQYQLLRISTIQESNNIYYADYVFSGTEKDLDKFPTASYTNMTITNEVGSALCLVKRKGYHVVSESKINIQVEIGCTSASDHQPEGICQEIISGMLGLDTVAKYKGTIAAGKGYYDVYPFVIMVNNKNEGLLFCEPDFASILTQGDVLRGYDFLNFNNKTGYYTLTTPLQQTSIFDFSIEILDNGEYPHSVQTQTCKEDSTTASFYQGSSKVRFRYNTPTEDNNISKHIDKARTTGFVEVVFVEPVGFIETSSLDELYQYQRTPEYLDKHSVVFKIAIKTNTLSNLGDTIPMVLSYANPIPDWNIAGVDVPNYGGWRFIIPVFYMFRNETGQPFIPFSNCTLIPREYGSSLLPASTHWTVLDPCNNQEILYYAPFTPKLEERSYKNGQSFPTITNHNLKITGRDFVLINQRPSKNAALYDKSKLYEACIEGEELDNLIVSQNGLTKTISASAGDESVIDYNYNSSTLLNINYPLALTRSTLFGAAIDKIYNRAPGELKKSVIWNGGIAAFDGNIVKIINDKMEWEVEKTITFTASIRDIIALGKTLYVFTEEGVYTLLPDFTVEYLLSEKVTRACVASTQLVFISDSNELYMTEFAPVPVAQMRFQTQNPYVIRKLKSDIIEHETEKWNVSDMLFLDGIVYISSDEYIYTYNIEADTFTKLKYNFSIEKLIEFDDKLFCLNYNPRTFVFQGNPYRYQSGVDSENPPYEGGT